MYVRIKRVRGRRYAYLVEGTREGGRVRQKVVRYLGPMAKVAYGVPEDTFVGGLAGKLDRRALNDAIRRIPLTFAELSEARKYAYPLALEGRRQGFLTRGTRQRVEGEDEALSAIAGSRFWQVFAEIGEGRYRMR